MADGDEEIDVGPLEAGQIKSLARDAISQLRRYGQELAKMDLAVDGGTLTYLLDTIGQEMRLDEMSA